VESVQIALNTVWIVTAAALVFFMQAGFAMLESGMVRSKNAVNVLMKNYIDMCFGALAFWLIGYGLMFGANPTGWFGTDHFVLHQVADGEYTFLLFHMMFAATTATIVSGALAERIRYWAYVVSATVISSFIYAVYGSWVWANVDGVSQGWLSQLGFIDFAGSVVVHSIGGWCALAGVIVLGPRLGRFGREGGSADGKTVTRDLPGHNLPLVALGGMILWLGWFGFNGGSTLEASASIGAIILNTHLAGAAGVIGAIAGLTLTRQPIYMTVTINGGLAGLVASCAGADAMEPAFAAVTGFIGGGLMVLGMQLLNQLRLDDPLGAIAVHGFAGVWGALAVALFVRGDYPIFQQLGIQALGAAAAFAWAFATAWVLFKLLDQVLNLRVNSMEERRGLDYVEHYEIGYPEFQQDLLHQGKE